MLKKLTSLLSLVKSVIGDDVLLETQATNDNRSYHISSKKIKSELGFEPKCTIEDAVIDLKNAFEGQQIPDSMDNEKYFNIKRMQSIELN